MSKDIYKNVQSSFILKSSKLEKMQKLINKMDKLWYIHTTEYSKAMEKNELQESHTIE